MILVDTSVLIPYLKKADIEVVEQFHEILEKELPFGINNYIYQELLQGCSSEKSFKLLKKYLDGQKFYHLEEGSASYAEAARMYFKLRKKGFTIRSTIDCLIARTAIENDLYLLHNDADFTRIAGIFPLKIWDI